MNMPNIPRKSLRQLLIDEEIALDYVKSADDHLQVVKEGLARGYLSEKELARATQALMSFQEEYVKARQAILDWFKGEKI